MVDEHEDDSPDPFDTYLEPGVALGAWANNTHVHRGRDEFTIDFIRHVPVTGQRVLVSRVVLAPVLAVELRDQLDQAWRGYSEWSMPEVDS